MNSLYITKLLGRPYVLPFGGRHLDWAQHIQKAAGEFQRTVWDAFVTSETPYCQAVINPWAAVWLGVFYTVCSPPCIGPGYLGDLFPRETGSLPMWHDIHMMSHPPSSLGLLNTWMSRANPCVLGLSTAYYYLSLRLETMAGKESTLWSENNHSLRCRWKGKTWIPIGLYRPTRLLCNPEYRAPSNIMSLTSLVLKLTLLGKLGITVTNTWGKQYDLFWSAVSEVSICRGPAPWFLGCAKTDHGQEEMGGWSCSLHDEPKLGWAGKVTEQAEPPIYALLPPAELHSLQLPDNTACSEPSLQIWGYEGHFSFKPELWGSFQF